MLTLRHLCNGPPLLMWGQILSYHPMTYHGTVQVALGKRLCRDIYISNMYLHKYNLKKVLPHFLFGSASHVA